MKHCNLLALLVCSLLIGCNSTPVLKTNTILPNSSLTDAKRLKLECEVAATKEIPSAMATYSNPTYVTPSNTDCRVAGVYSNRMECTTRGGQVLGGEINTVDANLNLRQRVYLQCLEKKGFVAYTLPVCTPEQINRAAALYPTPQSMQNYIQTIPASNSCYVKSNWHGDEFAINP